MRYEWDENKNQANIIKHGIDFEAASTVFDDNAGIELYDERNSSYEERYVFIGRMAYTPTILFVSFTERGDVKRIISARRALKDEVEGYYNGYYQL